MLHDDPLYLYRLSALAFAQESGSIERTALVYGLHRSTLYRWRGQLERWGPEALRPKGRRQPRMPNAISALVEQQVLAFAVGHPGFGPQRVSSELALDKWGAIQISPNGVWRVLRRHGLNTRAKRFSLRAGYAAVQPAIRPLSPQPERHLKVSRPGELIQMDCFYVGHLEETKGVVWQYTATDVVSAFTWAQIHASPRNPSPRWTSQLARHVAGELAKRGWQVEKVMSDNGNEFRAAQFETAVAETGASHVFIRSGRPQSNGCVERVHGTLLEEFWKPTFSRYVVPSITGFRRDLAEYLRYYNYERTHHGRWTKGRTPDAVLGARKMWS